MCKFYKDGFEFTFDLIAMIILISIIGLIIGIISLLFIDNTVNDLVIQRYVLYLFAGLIAVVYFVNTSQDLVQDLYKNHKTEDK